MFCTRIQICNRSWNWSPNSNWNRWSNDYDNMLWISCANENWIRFLWQCSGFGLFFLSVFISFCLSSALLPIQSNPIHCAMVSQGVYSLFTTHLPRWRGVWGVLSSIFIVTICLFKVKCWTRPRRARRQWKFLSYLLANKTQ